MDRSLPSHLRRLDDEYDLGRLETITAQRAPRVVLMALAGVLLLLAALPFVLAFLYLLGGEGAAARRGTGPVVHQRTSPAETSSSPSWPGSSSWRRP